MWDPGRDFEIFIEAEVEFFEMGKELDGGGELGEIIVTKVEVA